MAGYKKRLERIYRGRDDTLVPEGAYPNRGQLWAALLDAPYDRRMVILDKLLSAVEANDGLVRAGIEFVDQYDAQQRRLEDLVRFMNEQVDALTAAGYTTITPVAQSTYFERAATTASWRDRLKVAINGRY